MSLPAHLTIREGHLCIGGADCTALARTWGTPLYVTDGDRVLAKYRALREALSSRYPGIRILYAAKANGNLAILRLLGEAGAGADVFSSGELNLALRAGLPPERLLFNGNSKSPDDLSLAVREGVRVSVDSLDELRLLDSVAAEQGAEVEMAFRVNPLIEVKTHPKIATALRTSKFGIPHEQIREAYETALSCEHLRPVGVHCHIGSQILELEPFVRTAEVMTALAVRLADIGVKMRFIDLGGGLGIPYRHGIDTGPTAEEYAAAVIPAFMRGLEGSGLRPELWVEPGRFLVGDSTLLLTRVNSVKRAYHTFANVDAGFNLLIRPAMYDAYHEVLVADRADDAGTETYTVAGPICESGDILARDRRLPPVQAGTVLAVLDGGAYGFAMSSQYNARPRCAELLVRGGEVRTIRRSETLDDLIAPME